MKSSFSSTSSSFSTIFFRLFGFFFVCQLIFTCALPVSTGPKICIIGGGIGGSSAALFVRRAFGSDASIDLYERKMVGGRLALVQLSDEMYEAGGSIIHPRNRYMAELSKILDLQRANSSDGRMGLYNGKEFVFEESRFDAITYLNLLWRYGLSIFKWNTLVEEMLDNFDNVYDIQEDGYAFTNVAALLEAMDPRFVEMTKKSIEEVLKERGFDDLFISELCMAATRANFIQTTDVNGFVGAVSLAAAQPKLWSVKGGNYQLAQGALNLSRANLINSKVDKITLLNTGKYSIAVSVTGDESMDKIQEKEYDIVILAAPQTEDQASLEFSGFPSGVGQFPGSYQRTYATFVQGILNVSYFGFQKPSEGIDDIITINPDIPYDTIGRLDPVDVELKTEGKKATKVYKLFSPQPLSNAQLNDLFLEIEVTKVIDWLAYPHYTPPEKLGSFKIHDFLYYTSAIEWAGSAMEMSAVSARNAALLAFNEYHNKINNIDQRMPERSPKTEL